VQMSIRQARISVRENVMRKPGLEPGRVAPLDPKSSASTNSATSAGRTRTPAGNMHASSGAATCPTQRLLYPLRASWQKKSPGQSRTGRFSPHDSERCSSHRALNTRDSVSASERPRFPSPGSDTASGSDRSRAPSRRCRGARDPATGHPRTRTPSGARR
jgi:hypothetical protein